MTTEKVIYTDGRDVTVTDSSLKVKNTCYQISGITKLGMWTIKPHRAPGILLMIIGIAAIVFGYMKMVPSDLSLTTNNGSIDSNQLALWIGAGLLLIGIIAVAVSRQRYAVRIATAEGEKNAVVSEKREYITQIIDALNRAFHFNSPGTSFTSDQSQVVIR
jgi:hypothetical protein